MSDLTPARNELLRAIQDPRVPLRSIIALHGVLRLLDLVAEHDAPELHEDAVRIAREAVRHAPG